MTKVSAAMQRHQVDDSENELYTRFRYNQVTGLGYEKGINRRDPSTIIKVKEKYYIWWCCILLTVRQSLVFKLQNVNLFESW